ncbi:hypothetical protein BCR32DRAFT_263849 [Anaeromyces robustus]|uniref:Outer arm dynein light chain 1 n=1 Tax=Anaeromyces robustus TaxID=1754192 RepID=A0A1Y1XQG6_9FUNG|nr:hypothetical protein BCR32DRAFT_263849 [Anaeromyces robustus]|eukprot:ORX87981.1 hypothetical protein BCR32DRAFT_263849 [Anaeromyces robustus]
MNTYYAPPVPRVRIRNCREVDKKGNTLMTEKYIKQLCREQKLYVTPELNDKIYLHYKGFSKIENLTNYTGLKSLWLEGNGIDKIENLGHLKELRCLFLHQNCISKIENIETLENLDTLNLSNNLIKKVENISKLKVLKTLDISNNFLRNADDIRHLAECDSICILDLSKNKIDDPSIIDILEKMTNLAVLNLMNNPVIKKIANYRKIMVSRCKSLTYLDDRPVTKNERLATEAWVIGGLSAERAERQRQRDEERERHNRNFQAMMKLKERGMKIRMEKYGAYKEPEFKPELRKMRDDMLRKVNIPVEETEYNNTELSNPPPLEDVDKESLGVGKRDDLIISESKAPIRSTTLMSTKGIKIQIESDSESVPELTSDSESLSESESDRNYCKIFNGSTNKKNLIEELDDNDSSANDNHHSRIQEINNITVNDSHLTEVTANIKNNKSDLIIEDIGSDNSFEDKKSLVEEVKITRNKPLIEEIDNFNDNTRPLIDTPSQKILVEQLNDNKLSTEDINFDDKKLDKKINENKLFIEEITENSKENNKETNEKKILIENHNNEANRKINDKQLFIEDFCNTNEKDIKTSESKLLIKEINNENEAKINENKIYSKENNNKHKLIEELNNSYDDDDDEENNLITENKYIQDNYDDSKPKSLADTLINRISTGNTIYDIIDNELNKSLLTSKLERNIDESDTDSVDTEAELIIDNNENIQEDKKKIIVLEEQIPVLKTSFEKLCTEEESVFKQNIDNSEGNKSESEDIEAEIINTNEC